MVQAKSVEEIAGGGAEVAADGAVEVGHAAATGAGEGWHASEQAIPVTQAG